jgi:hypothetical protein
MFDKTAEDENWQSSISLEDGADEWSCDGQQLDISERGMCFHSRWRFDLSTELAVTISFAQEASWKLRLRGIVVGCEDLDAGCSRITLLFLEPVESLPVQLTRFFHSQFGELGGHSDGASRWIKMLN